MNVTSRIMPIFAAGATFLSLIANVEGQSLRRFEDVSNLAGILPNQNTPGMGAGVAAADFDDDGDVDIFLPQRDGVPDRLYRNLGDGTFEEIAAMAHLDSLSEHRTALWLDYDGDHDLDLFIANDDLLAASSFTLHAQIEPGVFVDVTESAGVARRPVIVNPDHHWGGICAGDINGDGFLDLFTAQWPGPCHLLLNRGDGTFEDISESSGVGIGVRHMHQSMMFDANHDGLMDIYVAVDFEPNILWINNGDHTFTDHAPTMHLDNAMNDMGLAISDYNNDGRLDLYITNVYVDDGPPRSWRHNVLYRNDSTRFATAFQDRSLDLAVADGRWGWGTTFLDYDLDGFVDIAATNGWGFDPWTEDASRLFRNVDGVSPFEDVSDDVGFNDTEFGSSLVSFDRDRDGDRDLLQLCNGGRLRLLDNRLDGRGSGHFLTVRPRMDGANHRAIGAVVQVRAKGRIQTRLITAGTSYMGQEPAEAHFGFGVESRVDALVVYWPDGAVSTVTNLPSDRVVTVRSPAE